MKSGEPTFHLVLPAGHNFNLFSEMLQHLPDGLAQIFLQTFMFPFRLITMD